MVQMTAVLLRSRLVWSGVVVSCLFGGAASHGLAKESPPSKAVREKGRTTRVFRLENVPATDMVSAVEEFLHSEGQVRAGITPQMEVIVVADKVRNLVVVNSPAKVMQAIDGLIAALDKRPPMIKAPCKLIEIGPDGKQRVLSRPVVMTLDGQPAVISVGELVPLVQPGLDASHAEAGYSISLKINLCGDATARLEASINKQEVDKTHGGGTRLVKKSVQVIETIPLDVPVKLVVDKADDGSARSWWEVIVNEVRPGPSGRKNPSPSDTVSRDKPQTKEVRHGRVYPSVRR